MHALIVSERKQLINTSYRVPTKPFNNIRLLISVYSSIPVVDIFHFTAICRKKCAPARSNNSFLEPGLSDAKVSRLKDICFVIGK